MCAENIGWIGEMLSNLYKIKWEEEELNYKKEKMMKCNSEVKSNEEVKREGKCWRKCNRRCGLLGKRGGFCLFGFFFLFH